MLRLLSSRGVIDMVHIDISITLLKQYSLPSLVNTHIKKTASMLHDFHHGIDSISMDISVHRIEIIEIENNLSIKWFEKKFSTLSSLLSSKAQGCKYFWTPSKPYHIGIHWITLAEFSQMSAHLPAFQSFLSFLHHFVMAKLATTSIRVNCPHFIELLFPCWYVYCISRLASFTLILSLFSFKVKE